MDRIFGLHVNRGIDVLRRGFAELRSNGLLERFHLFLRTFQFLPETVTDIVIRRTERYVDVGRRPNNYRDEGFLLIFEVPATAQTFLENLIEAAKQSPDSETAHLFKARTSSEKILESAVSDCFTALAYGEAGRVLEPINSSAAWQLDRLREPFRNGIGSVGEFFRHHPPPILVISPFNAEKLLSDLVLDDTEPRGVEFDPSVVFPRAASQFTNPLVPLSGPVPAFCETAIVNFGYHTRHGTRELPRRIYCSLSLVHLFLAVLQTNSLSADRKYQTSVDVMTAALKIAVMHELAHHMVAVLRAPGNSPRRKEALRGLDPFYDDCVARTADGNSSRLDAGLVVEKLWLRRHYGIAFEEDSTLILYFAPPSASSSDLFTRPSGRLKCEEGVSPTPESSSSSSESDSEEKKAEMLRLELELHNTTVVWAEKDERVAEFRTTQLPLFRGPPPVPSSNQRRTVRLIQPPAYQKASRSVTPTPCSEKAAVPFCSHHTGKPNPVQTHSHLKSCIACS
ncbi:hypothetical protein C8J57DRAFT_1597314 [Mycena rebaudengoi]|nr:hypothetical protein C8J57DRAFT_1597314 [Mycena rebaudengoi]